MSDEKPAGRGIDRRKLIRTAGVTSLGVAGAMQLGALGFFLRPRVLYEPSKIYLLGAPGDFPVGMATFREKERVFIFNNTDGMHAISSVCTHLGCNVRHKQGKGFQCPCHGSNFTETGAVKSGPAPSGLEWYRLRVSRKGVLLVDKGDKVDPGFRLRLG